MAGHDTGLVFSLVLIPHTPKPRLRQPRCSSWSAARNSGDSSFPSWGLESGRGAPCADLSGPPKVSAHVLGKGSHLIWWDLDLALDRAETCAAAPALLVLGRALGWSFALPDADASSVRWAGEEAQPCPPRHWASSVKVPKGRGVSLFILLLKNFMWRIQIYTRGAATVLLTQLL